MHIVSLIPVNKVDWKTAIESMRLHEGFSYLTGKSRVKNLYAKKSDFKVQSLTVFLYKKL